MFKYNIWHIEHHIITRQIYILYKFDYALSKIANEITKIPRTVKKIVYYQKRTIFFSFRSFLIFEGPSTKFLLNWFLMYERRAYSYFQDK